MTIVLRKVLNRLGDFLFSYRRTAILFFLLISVLLGFYALQLKVESGFKKSLPQNHPYMEVFNKHQQEFGSANRILIAVVSRDGDIFNAEFLDTLKQITDTVFLLPGVNKATVRSLFTPNVRFIEILEDGLHAGRVVPADYTGSDADIEKVKSNAMKAGIIGRLLANDLSAALVSADLIEIDPTTREKLNYFKVADLLEDQIRTPFSDESTSIHVIGFAKAVGDIAKGAKEVLIFFGVAFLMTALLVYLFTHSVRYTALLLLCSALAVVWTLGFLSVDGRAIDPISILVPFLVFAIGVSHGVQVVNAASGRVLAGAGAVESAKLAYRRLILPGAIALASDCAGFLAIMLIEVEIIRDLAVTASIGMASILACNLLLLPVLISYVNQSERFIRVAQRAKQRKQVIWKYLARIATMPFAAIYAAGALVIAIGSYFISLNLIVGDKHQGIPELREDSQYNIDSRLIADRFAIGLDVLNVIVETKQYGCVEFEIVDRIDDFTVKMGQVPGVSAVLSVPIVARQQSIGFNEGNPKWDTLSRNSQVLVQTANLGSSSGLANLDCSVMPVMIFPENHYEETINRIIEEIKSYDSEFGDDLLDFQIGTGNVGIMATSNELIRDTKIKMMVWVYVAVTALCLVAFRSIRGALSVALPLAVVTSLAFALMAILEIGLKISTLPMLALGVGIGVDYGIYIFTYVQREWKKGANLVDAFESAFNVTGNAVMVTGLTLACGVLTWIFSDLQFQKDMGILLTFMFLASMLGALLTLPAIARLLYGARKK